MIGNIMASFLVIVSGLSPVFSWKRVISSCILISSNRTYVILFLFLLALDGAEAPQEDRNESHDDQTAICHHHPLRGSWDLPGRIDWLRGWLGVSHCSEISNKIIGLSN